MVYYVIVFWVSLIGHPGLVDKAVIPYGDDVEGAPGHACAVYATEEAQDWVDKHPAWVMLTDELHKPRCVEKREI